MEKDQKDSFDRPDPDALLKLARREEAYASAGKLKIFLGYSAGVGKTYAMLEAAQRLRKEGVDVVLGYVEAHKRPETLALLDGLEAVPRRIVSYKTAFLEEMDLDAVIRRRPAVAIVDEFAHTNAPGSRHAKRYQDIEELLANGIDVYTTLNVQHLESLNDVVAKVTGVAMRETLPDRVFDEAREVEVIDIPIGELLKRFREGRVYLPDAAEHAINNFFTENNLTALRELALRRAAKRIDSQMHGFVQRRLGAGPLPVGDRLLVCVSPYPSSLELVRACRILAAGLDAEWYAVYVETPGRALSAAEKDRLAKTMSLAEELGGKAVTLAGSRMADEVVGYARRQNVTKILIGKPLRRRMKELLSGTVVDQLIRKSGQIDVHVINRSYSPEKTAEKPAENEFDWRGYAGSLALVAAATVLGLVTRRYFGPTNLVMYYLLAVVASSVFFGRGPSILAATAGVAVFDFIFISPYFSFAVGDTEYLFTFFVLFVVGLVIGTLTTRVKRQAESAHAREVYTASLYGLSRDLSATREKKEVSEFVLRHVRETIDSQVAVFLREKDSLVVQKNTDNYPLDDKERAVADWTFRNGQPAGRGTDTLAGAFGYYIPIRMAQTVYGVLGVRNKTVRRTGMRLEDRRLLESFAGQAAAALERIYYSEEAQKTRLLEEKDKLQSALFNSISHDLRTPLVSITGSLSGMLKNPKMDEESRKELLENAYEEAGRLNRLVGNLLDMARLEASALKVAPSLCDIGDVIGSALKELEERLEDRKVGVHVQEGLPHVPMDFGLIMKVLVNLIENAVKYSPFGLPIDLDARERNGRIEIRVLDRGLGIPAEDLSHVFDKFYRVKRPQNFEGTGLGLSICQGIVEAHGGKIWAENRPEGGTVVTVSLPLKRRQAP